MDVKVCNFTIMEKGNTDNKFVVREEWIEESLTRNVFDGAPIVFNKDQDFKDYRDDDIVKNFIEEECIGYVIPGTVRFDGCKVTADVMLRNDFSGRTHYDNWCIQRDADNSWFYYLSCELFRMEE